MPNAEYVILKELLAREPGWVSGSALAAKLGVSRVAVWQHMSRLRAAGFVFEARRSLGYRLGARPPTLHPTLIESLLKVRPRGFSLLVLDEVDSTNDEAARQFAARRPAPFAILARRQTRGRGRFGRVWHSASPTNLYASFAFRPRVTPRQMQTFTLWMGVNVCELLANFTGASPGIKWPNDLVHQGRKVGGMLTEARIDADHTRDLVFGLGLNVNTPDSAWPREIAPRATTLAREAGRQLDLNQLAASIVGRVLAAYDRFLARAPLDEVADLWSHHDMLAGRRITVVQGSATHTGIARGIDNEGALLLRTEAGRTLRFRAGEVTLRKE